MRVSINDLAERAKTIENNLKTEGFDVKIHSHFAYGAFSYYFQFANGKQLCMSFGTKAETFERLNSLYYQTLARAEYYKEI